MGMPAKRPVTDADDHLVDSSNDVDRCYRLSRPASLPHWNTQLLFLRDALKAACDGTDAAACDAAQPSSVARLLCCAASGDGDAAPLSGVWHAAGVLADAVLQRQEAAGVPAERTYFEVLLGVQEPLWKRWKARGKLVRAYVPYGPEWRAYSQRRLRKNPEILRHLIKATLRLS